MIKYIFQLGSIAPFETI